MREDFFVGRAEECFVLEIARSEKTIVHAPTVVDSVPLYALSNLFRE